MAEYDPFQYMEKLYRSDLLQKPLLGRIIETIGLPAGSRGLDAGCGVGLQMPLLTEAVGAAGHVTGLDILPEFIAEAGKNTVKWGLSDRTELIQGDIFDPPFGDREFDWIWSASCACYSMQRPLELLNRFQRILKPGGLLLLAIWSAQQLLPGYPLLEAKLNATAAGIAPFKRGDRPEHHFLRLPGWMERAGFVDVRARPFSEGVCAPLSAPMHDALLSLIEMRWPKMQKELRPPERRLYLRITDPSSPQFILNLPGYYAFYTFTLFSAVRP